MKFETQVVHAGDRKRERATAIPSTTPIHLATTYFYETAEQLDRIFGHEEEGPSYSRYENPTNSALEELTTTLENGHGSLATCAGMTALQLAFQAALLDRPHSIVSSGSIYGATVKLLDQVMAPFGVEVKYVDICDLAAVQKTIAAETPGCVFLESISNPLLRVADIPKIAAMASAAGAALVVDNTFACPMLMRPLDLGANIVVHSATKYLSGHGDVLGGIVVSDAGHHQNVRMLSRISGGTLGPFESYLTMRGIKTLALRYERQCLSSGGRTRLLLRRPASPRRRHHRTTLPVRSLWRHLRLRNKERR
jgi:cystathionine beta-lyase/cystathionine gamma-synthase